MASRIPLLEKELETYKDHKKELLATAEGKYVLIKNNMILGIFDTWDEAIHEAYRRLGDVPFMVQQITETEVPLDFSPNTLDL
jgi:hypothetical protein